MNLRICTDIIVKIKKTLEASSITIEIVFNRDVYCNIMRSLVKIVILRNFLIKVILKIEMFLTYFLIKYSMKKFARAIFRYIIHISVQTKFYSTCSRPYKLIRVPITSDLFVEL